MTIEELQTAAEKAIAEGDFDKAEELIEQIKNFQETGASDKRSDEDNFEKSDEDKKDEDKKDDDEKEKEEQRSEKKMEQRSEKQTDKGEKRKMAEKVLDQQGTEDVELRALNTFIRSKGEEKRDGLTTVGAEAVIPVERLTTPQKQPENVVDLRDYVEKIPVTTGSGSYPVLLKNKGVMISVEELEKNPELAKPKFKKVSWEVGTYRGFVPISQESIDDSDVDLAALVSEDIKSQERNTANAQISKVLKTATAKTLTSIDDLKDLINVEVDTAYSISVIASQSFFNAVDKLKDKDGRYLLQQDITSASGYKLIGKTIAIISDDVIGSKAKDQVAFIGDSKAFAKYFDRKQVSVRWQDNDVYGQVLAAAARLDVESADTDAGFYATLALSEDEGK
ncbi:phage major capsid protein [Brochothrix thermosphacta]|uniref:phage major capsid protein n=1 Tax=Brochothrix thermosphacta TaxID=2756 RepID=UPI0039AEBA62